MAKLGTEEKPVRFRVQTEERLTEVAAICQENNWKFVGSIEPDNDENTEELDYLLDPDSFDGKEPDMNKMNTPFKKTEPQIGRNDLCPCGSGKKYKKCCM